MKRLGFQFVLIVALLGARLPAQSSETNCTVTILNRSVQLGPGGSFAIPNLPYQPGFYRARVTCTDDGQASGGQSAFFVLSPNRGIEIPRITLGPLSPLPLGLTVSSPKTNLATKGETAQLVATASLANGGTANVSSYAQGTLWSSSSPGVADVTSNGLVTAVSPGQVIIQALNEGVQATFNLAVTIPRDTDGDGIPDDYELAFGMNPNDGSDGALDFDADGLTNVQEYQLGTNPRAADTDGDTVLDGEEVRIGTNPSKADTDGDSLADGDEVRRGINPLASDTDRDGIPDGLELTFGLNPLVADPTTRVQGRVLDTNGAPASGINVTVFGVLTTRSDESGSFVLENVPANLGAIKASAEVVRSGRVFDSTSASVTAVGGGVTDLRNLTLRLNSGNVVGTVTDPLNVVVASALVTVSNGQDTRTTKTDANGFYRVPNMTAGSLVVTVRDPKTGLRGRAQGTLSLNQSTVINVRLSPFGSVAGTVYQRDGVTPLGAGVNVTLSGSTHLTAQTDPLGKYRFEFVPLGTYAVDVTDSSGNHGRSSGEILATSQVIISDISFLGRGAVVGLVLNGAQPVSNAVVTLSGLGIFGGSGSTVSEASGRFAFSNLFAGPFQVTAQIPTTRLAGAITGAVEFDGQLFSNNVVLAASGTITGTVFRADGTSVVAGAQVSLTRITGSSASPMGLVAITDEAGKFGFSLIPIGTYLIDAIDPARGDRGRNSSAVLSSQNQVLVRNVTLFGQGSVTVSVRDGAGSTVGGAQVSVLIPPPFGATLSAVSDATGAAAFDVVQAGSIQVNTKDPQTGLTGSTNGFVGVGAYTNIVLRLRSAGIIAGRVFLPDGTTPAPGISVQLGGTSFETFGVSRQQKTGADGAFRFENSVLGIYSLQAIDSSGLRRSQANNLALTNHAQQLLRDLAMVGVGTVTGFVRFVDSTPVSGVPVYVSSQASNGFGGTFGANADVNGRYVIPNVPVGPFTVIVQTRINFIDYSGNAAGQIQSNGQTVSADVQLNGNLVNSITSLFDGNNVPYDLQSHGGLRSGALNVFGVPQVDHGAARLEIVSGSTVTQFVGRLPAVSSLNGREISITQTNLAGLDVTRRVYVPRDGYFARYLEVLSNRSPSAITVELRLTSNFRYTTTPTLSEPRIISTSSGDAVLSVSNAPTRDRWVVVDDNVDTDPFLTSTLPAVAHVFDGTNGQRQAATATFTLDPADNLGFGKLVERWTNITVAANTNIKILHFVAQQMNRASAQASATRLAQAPPEALTGLTFSDLRSVQNFALPTNGSSVPALVSLTGSISGLVLSGDAATPLGNSVVSYRSTNLYFGRTYTDVADFAGRFNFENYSRGGPGVIPQNGFVLSATNSSIGALAPETNGTFVAGANAATQNVVFTGVGLLTGTVRRHNNVVASDGTVRVTGESLPGPLTIGIAVNGVYSVKALEPDIYSLFAEVPTTQGSPLTGAASAPVVAGQTTTANIVIQETGTLIGALRRTNGSVAVNLRVQLRGAGNFTRSVSTDTGGRFTFADAPSGPVTLEAFEPANNTAARADVAVLTDQTVTQDLFLTADGAVTGTVLASSGQPFAGAQVTLTVGSTILSTNASSNGVYRFPIVPLGTALVVARDAGTGFRGATNGLLAVSGQTLNLNVNAAAVGSVTGTVYQPNGITPAPGAIVSAFGGALSTVANGAGNYLLDFLPLGSVTVNATKAATGESGSANVIINSNSAVASANVVLSPVVNISGTTLGEGNVQTRDAVFTLNLSTPSSLPGYVRYFTSNGTAFALSDFVPTNGLISFPPGVTNRSVVVKVLGDSTLESDETFSVLLANATNITLVVTQATATITNDDRLSGQIDHFEWAAVPGPQLHQVPFTVAITARDLSNGLVTNFTGPVRLSATVGGGPFSGTLMGLPAGASIQNNPFPMQVGNRFTPAVDISVTHVVHYFGSKVTIATESGEVLLAQGVTSSPGTWIETPLQQPLLLHAGQRYVITTLLPAGVNGYRRFGLPNPFPHGVLGDAVLGANLSQNPLYFGWWMVDLRYSPITSVPVAMSPTNSGLFSSGVWTGAVTILAPATNAVLAADDGDGHFGLANGIDVRYGNDLLVSVQASPEPVPIGGTLFYTITVTNTGPTVATNVVVTNSLPTGFAFLSANGTLGTCAFSNGTVVCVMPSVARDSIAQVGIAVRPERVVTEFVFSNATFREVLVTNVVGITRDGLDGHPANNVAQAVTRVLRPTVSISDVTVREGNGESRAAVFNLRLSYPTTEEVYLFYATYNGSQSTATATPGIDYVRTVGNVIFAPGETNKIVQVPILGDSIPEPSETIYLFLSAPSTATLTRTNGVATILDDDGLPGQIHHFDWATISSPKFANEPFPVTITAKNFSGGTVSNFAGHAFLSATAPTAGVTNLLVKSDPHVSTSSSTLPTSLGYSFIPDTNIVVTHVRRYFGQSVSIWTDDGLLLMRQSVTGAPAVWVEAPLPEPLLLSAGVRYRISTHAPAGTFYFRNFDSDYFPDGVIDGSYYGNEDSFPSEDSGSPRWLVGLKYSVSTLASVSITPTNTTFFTNGVWSGFVNIVAPYTNAVLRADDGDGSTGKANPIDILLRNDLAVMAVANPSTADVRSNLIYTITVSNAGPLTATGVVLTNLLPAEVNVVSTVVSQGSFASEGRITTCTIGTLGASASATLTVTCKPTMDRIVLTNVANVGRAEADAYFGNNTFVLQTPVRGFSDGAVAVVTSGSPEETEDVRNKIASLGFFPRVEIISASGDSPVPSLFDLQRYSAVFVYSSGFLNDAQIWGDVLADYLDQGNGVVVAALALDNSYGLNGRLVSENYLPFTFGDFTFESSLNLVPDLPQHPVLNGVNSLESGDETYLDSPLTLTAGANLVAHWNNDELLVGVKQLAAGRTVGLNFYPPSSDVYSGYWDATTDGARLMANALRWVSPTSTPLTNDLTLRLTQVPGELPVGGTLTYTLIVTNSGPSPATGIVLTNTLPSSVVVIALSSSRGTVTNVGNIVSANLGTLPTGTNAVITITAQARVSGSLTNTASIFRAEADAFLRNNSAASVASVQVPELFAENSEVVEGDTRTTNIQFNISLSFPSPEVISLQFATFFAVATPGSDYIETNGTLVFQPGETNKPLRVEVVGDTTHEDDEFFHLEFQGATNATITVGAVDGTILNDDPFPLLTISDASVAEGGSGTRDMVFTASLSAPSETIVYLEYATTNETALAGSDYVGTNFYVIFNRGETNQSIRIPIIGDHVTEPNETFFVGFSTVSGATPIRSQGTATILNDDGIAGLLDHFDWAPISSPQLVGVPFPVMITARDFFGTVLANFAGPLVINDGYPTAITNSIFKNRTYSASGLTSAELTLAYAITPTTDLVVTHLRNYFGDKVSIWTDAGELVVSSPVINQPTFWRETALPSPVTLQRGTRYRIAIHKAPNLIHYTSGPGEVIPEIGYYIDTFYSSIGDVFPNGNIVGSTAPMVDIKYIARLTPRFSPLVSGPFTNGVWSGAITALVPTNNVQLGVDDFLGHSGVANPINVLTRPDLTVGVGPNPLSTGGTVRVSLNILNQSAATATGVTVTNLLPAGMTLLSVTQSQGNFSVAGSQVICNIGTLPANTGYLPTSLATVTLFVRANAEGVFTNYAWAGRNETSADASRVVASVIVVGGDAPSVGFFTDGNELTTAPATVINRVGLKPVHITDIGSFNLTSVPILMLNNFQFPPSLALQQRLPALETWVRNGGVLVLHNGYHGNIPYFNSLLQGAPDLVPGFYSYVRVTPPGDTLVTTGPFGMLIDYDTQGFTSLTLPGYGAMIPPDALPDNSRLILDLAVSSGPNPAAAFSYPLGKGYVYYSAIPLDYYLELADARAMTNIYAPNVLAYARSLSAAVITNDLPRTVHFVFGPGTTGWTNGAFQLQIAGLSGHGAVIISASTNLLDWKPIFTNSPVNGTIQFFDADASNKMFRFYRVDER